MDWLTADSGISNLVVIIMLVAGPLFGLIIGWLVGDFRLHKRIAETNLRWQAELDRVEMKWRELIRVGFGQDSPE